MEYFNKSDWLEATHHDDWYLRIKSDYQKLLARAEKHPDEAVSIKEAVRGFFEELLAQGKLALGGPDVELDSQRRPIQQAVIHHSKRAPGYYTLDRLNAVHLLNLYVPYYNGEKPRGKAVSSNHYRNGKMVFFGYHWWIETDGTTICLLPDDAIGWHAGNWEVNCQSVGICINDDLTDKVPPAAALQSVRRILQHYEERYDRLRVVGHREVNPKTRCPGDTFLSDWKRELLNV